MLNIIFQGDPGIGGQQGETGSDGAQVDRE
jgi:hypothetical protein